TTSTARRPVARPLRRPPPTRTRRKTPPDRDRVDGPVDLCQIPRAAAGCSVQGGLIGGYTSSGFGPNARASPCAGLLRRFLARDLHARRDEGAPPPRQVVGPPRATRRQPCGRPAARVRLRG